MKQNQTEFTKQQKKKRIFLLLLPAVIIPFLTLLLWSLGILGSNAADAAPTGGLNTQLPDAKLKENKTWNKLSFYEQADKDSLRYQDELKSDPSFRSRLDSSVSVGAFSYIPLPETYPDPNEVRVNQKLAQLNAALNNNTTESQYQKNNPANQIGEPAIKVEDVNRLKQMLQAVNQPDSNTDPETEQLNGMMDKILDIQHPDRVKERIQLESISNKKAVYPVTIHTEESFVSLLGNSKQKRLSVKSKSAFYSLSNDTAALEQDDNTFSATVYETQTVTDGSLMKLITKNDIYVNGTLIPQGNFVYALVSFATQRLNLAVSSIKYLNKILPVELVVYDSDGLPGVHISNIQRSDVAKQSGSEAISNLDMASLDPSIGMQAASAGIAATKALFNKKVKTIKVTIPAGYKVFLKSDFGN